MNRSLFLNLLVSLLALAGWGSAVAASGSTDPSLEELKAPVAAPFNLTIRNRAWDGNTHGMPSGRAELEADGQPIWQLADVTSAAASADGSTVALLTSDYQVFASRLPEPPRRIVGGPYDGPSLSSDGTFLVVQRLGEEGHILEKMFNTRGIALINLDTGEDRLLLQGNDLFAPSFATDEKVFFGSGGEDRMASLYVLDVASMKVARVTNRVKDARQTFPSDRPRLADGAIAYSADGEPYRVPEPKAEDYLPFQRFDAPEPVEMEAQPQVGPVRLRRPNTQVNVPAIYWYYDQNKAVGQIRDWNCLLLTYDQHMGTDINQAMGFDVVAPASGVVFQRYDGCPNSGGPGGCGQGYGNHVRMRHSDKTISIEAHGKNGTVVGLGSYPCGAKLMESASSGNSSKPHIHHENWHDVVTRKYDPYRGSCDPDDASKWGQQNGYLGLPGATCTQ